MNQVIYTAPKLDTEVYYKPGGPMIDLLRDHLTNMTDQQRKVCGSVVDEWNTMVARIAFLESENSKLFQDVARLTRDITSMREASKLGDLMVAVHSGAKLKGVTNVKLVAAKRVHTKRSATKKGKR